MTSGKYLRTNYRRTGGQLDIVAVGAHMLSTCMFGDSVGHNYPNAGFMVFSVSGSIQGAEVTGGMIDGGSLVGVSEAWIDSTYGLMSRYYGDGQFDSGYKFMPVGFRFLSFSDVGMADHDASIPIANMVGVSYLSQSLLLVSLAIQLAASGLSVCLRGTAEFKAAVWGFIISSP